MKKIILLAIGILLVIVCIALLTKFGQPEQINETKLQGINAEKKSTQSDVQRKLDDLGQQDEKYRRMSQEAAQALFKAFAEENWDEVLKFLSCNSDSQEFQYYKDEYGGLEIIKIGESFKPDNYRGWKVPYEVRLKKSGEIQKHNLALDVGPDGQFVVDGGI